MFNSKASKRSRNLQVSVLFPSTKNRGVACNILVGSFRTLTFHCVSIPLLLLECPSSYSLHSMHDYILLSESEQLLLQLLVEDRTCNNTLGSSGATTKCLILLATWTTLLDRDKSNLKCRSIDLQLFSLASAPYCVHSRPSSLFYELSKKT